MLIVALSLLSLSPQSVEAISRAAAIAASRDARFEVVSALDIADSVDLEAERQACGLESESCASQLAGAWNARFLLFVRLYAVGDEAHAALTLHDLQVGSVIERSDVAGTDEKALFAAVQLDTGAVLRRVVLPPSTRSRLFVSRAAVDSSALTASTVAPRAPMAEKSSGSLVPGLVVLGVGGAVAGAGALVGIEANSVVAAATSTGSDKQAASGRRAIGLGAVGVGGAIVAVGAGLLLWQAFGEDQ